MKKTMALLLAVLMVLSTISVMATENEQLEVSQAEVDVTNFEPFAIIPSAQGYPGPTHRFIVSTADWPFAVTENNQLVGCVLNGTAIYNGSVQGLSAEIPFINVPIEASEYRSATVAAIDYMLPEGYTIDQTGAEIGNYTYNLTLSPIPVFELSESEIVLGEAGASAELSWVPSLAASFDPSITYEVVLNGTVTKSYDYTGRDHIYEMTFDAETGGLNLGDNTIEIVMKKDGSEIERVTEIIHVDVAALTTPYFEGAQISVPWNADTPAEEMADTLEMDWQDAQVNDGEFEGQYNIYVNNELLTTVSESNYTLQDLAPLTEYDIKITIVDNDVELDTYITTLTNSFKTANIPTVQVEEITETTAVLNITPVFGGDAEYEIAAFGQPVEFTAEGNAITTRNLLSGTEYDFTIKMTEIMPRKGIEYSTMLETSFVTVAKDDSGLTYAEGMPVINYTTAEAVGRLGNVASGSITEATNNGLWNCFPGDDRTYQGIFGLTGAYAATLGSGHSFTMDFDVSVAGDYYIGSQLHAYEENNRYMTVTIDGNTLPDKYTCATMKKIVSENPVHLNAGTHTITLKANGGWCRVDHVVFIPAKNHSAALSAFESVATVEETNDKFGVSKEIITDTNVSATALGPDKILVTWMPNAVAQGKELSFSISLNGGEAVEYDNAGRSHMFVLDDGIIIGKNLINLTVTYDEVLETSIIKEVDIKSELEISSLVTDADEDGYVESASITLNNPTGHIETANVLFVVYHNNRVVEKCFEQVSVFLSETVTFDLTTPAQKMQQAQKLNPGKYQLKMFVLDDEYKVTPFTY